MTENITEPKNKLLFTITGSTVILVSVLNMAGWVFNIAILTRLMPALPAIKFNTAMVFAFSGAATLLLNYVNSKPGRRVYYGLAAVIFCTGFITILQYLFNINTGIDNIFITDSTPVSLVNQYPGRIARAAAVSFCLLGIAFAGIVSPLKWQRKVAQYILHVVAAIGYVVILGYILSVSAAQNTLPYISMALYAGIILFTLSSILTVYNSSLGITGLFTGKGVGNEMVRKLFPVLTGVIVLLSYIRIKLFAIHIVSIDFGVAIASTIFLAVLLVLLNRTARQLNKLEETKLQAEAANYHLNLDIAAAEKIWRETEEINKRNLLFVQQAPSAIAMCDNDMVYMAVSQQWVKDYRLEGLQVIGRLFYDVTPGLPQQTVDLHNRCLKGATSKSSGKYFVWPGGRKQWVAWDIRPWYDNGGKIGGLLIYTFDVTEAKEKEILIKETTERLAEAQQIAHVGSWDWDIPGSKLTWSDEQYRIFGYEPGTVDPNNGLFYTMMHPDDKDRVMNTIGDAFLGKGLYAFECRLVHANGTVRDVESLARILRNDDGHPVRIIGTLSDITTRKKLERGLMISEKEFRSSFENSAIGMALTSLHGRFLKVNQELARMLGYTATELVQLTFMDITDPAEVKDNVSKMHQMAAKAIGKYETEKRYIHKNGSTVWVILTVSMVFNEQQEPLYMVSQMTDITERKRIEKDLQRVNTELNSLFNAETHVSIIGTDMNGLITHFSRGAEILLGYKASEMIGLRSPSIIHDKTEVSIRAKELSVLLNKEVLVSEVFVAFAEGNNFESREWIYVRKDGTHLPVHLVISPTKDEQGNIKGYLGIATDITERKEAEETRKNNAVLKSRNKEMEEFAYIASHDLQEPLRTVSSFINLMNEEFSEQIPAEAHQYLQFISASSNRMRELIKGLLEFSRLGKQKVAEPVDCNILVKEVIEDLGQAIKESDAIIQAGPMPVINALPTEMKQLFQNLVSNAIKFCKPGINPQIQINATQVPGFWQFEIDDNGIGIDPVHYQKIFILFQRLHKRDDYPGTGIGLSYCKKIVELHHGRIWVESVPGRGSRFFFTISNHNL